MNRRGFLSALISAGVAAAADPERLLWTPGKKLISIPAPQPIEILRIPDPLPFLIDDLFTLGSDETIYRITSVAINCIGFERISLPWDCAR